MAPLIHDLHTTLRRRFQSVRVEAPHGRFVVAVTGSVAAGKSTFAGELKCAMADWPERPAVEIVPTDGFLHSNAVLAERGLSLRKGFPESYDVDALASALADLKRGARTEIPRYSHVTYDVDPSDRQTVEHADLLILDGLHLGRVKIRQSMRLIDSLIYLDADERHIESWFHARLVPLMQAGRTDTKSFYYAFRTLDDAGLRAFSERVWREINLPNLRDHIAGDRALADIVLKKTADHAISRIELAEPDAAAQPAGGR